VAHAPPDSALPRRARIREWAQAALCPRADAWDRDESLPQEVVEALAAQGWLGASVAAEWGGLGWDPLDVGILHEEIGRACSSVRSLLTVHGMVAHAVGRWGTAEQRRHWLPRLAAGTAVAGFALSEPEVGSDARSVQATARRVPGGFRLDGHKKWVTFGERADVFLVFARCDGRPCAFLVEPDAPTLDRQPTRGLLGLRASHTAELRLDGHLVPDGALLGRVGAGFPLIALHALDWGRHSVAWGCVGIAQACVDASVAYATRRKQFGAPQLVDRMLTDMIVDVRAARALCTDAAGLRAGRDPRAIGETMIAKYFASNAAARASRDAVQIHGANGCASGYPVQRCFRDAKIMQIIEGSNEIHQVGIARQADCRDARGAGP